MLDIKGDFSKVESEFVSVCRLVERLQIISRHESRSGEATIVDVCNWLKMKISEMGIFLPEIKKITDFYTIETVFPDGGVEENTEWLIDKLNIITKMKCLPIRNDEEPGIDDWFDQRLHTNGFLREEIEDFIPELVKVIEFPTLQTRETKINVSAIETKYAPSSQSHHQEFVDIPEQSCEWDNFKGRDTALMMIAGMAIALSKSGESFKRGGELNVSAVARGAAQAINRFGAGVDVTGRALENLVRDALKQHTSKLPDS
ncbi:MAG: hypothetical protein ACRDD5_07000 [Silvania sp.]|uniref:hypothetical protein n=1 Tax=Silvania sp. TaxID=3016633 RepID=UPI003EE648C4